jgi:hypothetical protein
MAWVRFDPGFSRHRKRLKAGPVANWLWVCAIDYCVEHLTDGVLPGEAADTLIPGLPATQRKAAIERLMSLGAIVRHGDDYLVHDFLVYQESAAEVRRQREAGRERARHSRAKRQGYTPERAPNVPGTSAERAPSVRNSPVLSCPDTPPTPPGVSGRTDPKLHRCTHSVTCPGRKPLQPDGLTACTDESGRPVYTWPPDLPAHQRRPGWAPGSTPHPVPGEHQPA